MSETSVREKAFHEAMAKLAERRNSPPNEEQLRLMRDFKGGENVGRMTSAARLHSLRIAAGQSLEDVERGTRLHVALLRTLEHGRPMTEAQAKVLAQHFGVLVDDIVLGN